MKISLAALIVAGGLVTATGQQTPGRALPDNNLAYPVLITWATEQGRGSGTGFYIDTGKFVFLVTAKHVLFDENTGFVKATSFNAVSYSKDPNEQISNSASVDISKLQPENLVKHPSQDVVIVRMFSNAEGNKISPLPGITAHSYAKAGITVVPLSGIKKYDEVLVGNDAILLGYPTSLGLKVMPQLDLSRPLLRKGIVAGKTPRTHSLILDCPAYFGNSGGPVLEIDQQSPASRNFLIIGIVSQYVPYAESGTMFAMQINSGYSIATPMDFVLDLMK